MFKINEVTKYYTTTRPVTADEIVSTALDILAIRLPHTDALTSPETVKSYLITQYAGLEHEVFSILLLDTHTLKLTVGPGDDMEPVVTIMLPRRASHRDWSPGHTARHSDSLRYGFWSWTVLLSWYDLKSVTFATRTATQPIKKGYRKTITL